MKKNKNSNNHFNSKCDFKSPLEEKNGVYVNKNLTKQHKILKKLAVVSLTLLIIFVIFVAMLFAMINFSSAEIIPQKLSPKYDNSTVLDTNGDAINGENSNMYCVISNLNQHTIDAFVSIEDKRFYTHSGIDYKRIASAMLKNMKNGKIVEGGSTISQQIIKNTHLDNQKTLDRKFREAQLAVNLEKKYSKDEILEIYLNIIYFGSGQYGIENASHKFFGKTSNELTLMESAMLAAIPKSPTKYNIINKFNNNTQRAKVVLNAMLAQGKITQNELDCALKQDIVLKNDLIENTLYDNYINNAIWEAADILKINTNTLLNEKYRITTYFDKQIQVNLSNITTDDKYSLNCDITPNKVGLCVDNKSGGVVAFESNFSENIRKFKRQLGSTLKPLAVYAPAFEMGIVTSLSKLNDSPTNFDGYCPTNYMDIYLGNASVKDCLIHSQNVSAVELINKVGIKNSLKYLNKLGFDIPDNECYMSLALGATTRGNTFMELCSAYSSFASGGLYRSATFVKEIATADGTIVFSNKNRTSERVFAESTASQINDILLACSKEGTAKKLATIDFDVASKTGTVSCRDKNFNTDIYNVSYTQQHTLMFWQGSFDGNVMPITMTGGGQTTAMAKEFYSNYECTQRQFATSHDMQDVYIDMHAYNTDNQLLIASDNCPQYAKIKTKIDKKYLPKKDTTYDKMIVDNLKIVIKNNEKYLSFVANPRLCYNIIEKSFLCNDLFLANISGKSGEILIPISNFMQDNCLSTINITPSFVDDNGQIVQGVTVKKNVMFDIEIY